MSLTCLKTTIVEQDKYFYDRSLKIPAADLIAFFSFLSLCSFVVIIRTKQEEIELHASLSLSLVRFLFFFYSTRHDSRRFLSILFNINEDLRITIDIINHYFQERIWFNHPLTPRSLEKKRRRNFFSFVVCQLIFMPFALVLVHWKSWWFHLVRLIFSWHSLEILFSNNKKLIKIPAKSIRMRITSQSVKRV